MNPEFVRGRGRILLVDDDPGLLRLISIRLRAEQYEVEAIPVKRSGERKSSPKRYALWLESC
jgi:two-component system response regulator GlrR